MARRGDAGPTTKHHHVDHELAVVLADRAVCRTKPGISVVGGLGPLPGHVIDLPKRYPSPLGYEAAGTILAVGPAVTHLSVGDYVSTVPAFSMSDYGTYGDHALVPAHAAIKMDRSMPPLVAASVWMQYVTAWKALVAFDELKSGDWALFTAASGGLGAAAVQIAKQMGVKSIITTRSANKRTLLEQLGADHIIVTDEENLVDKVMEYTGELGVNFAWEGVNGPQLPEVVSCMAYRGVINVYGVLHPDAVTGTPFPVLDVITKNLIIRGYNLFQFTDAPLRFQGEKFPYDKEFYPKAVEFVRRGLESGEFVPEIAKVFDFTLEDLREAQHYVENNTGLNKTVVRFPGS
jgi:NADPH2:quinone reductase